MQDTHHPTIMIVEDNPQINRLFRKQFRSNGLDTYSTCSVQQTLQQLNEGFIPDAIILDLELADGNGTQILDYLKQRGLHDIPVVIVSAHAYSNFYDITDYTVADVLVKPVSPRGLSVLVRTLLQPVAAV